MKRFAVLLVLVCATVVTGLVAQGAAAALSVTNVVSACGDNGSYSFVLSGTLPPGVYGIAVSDSVYSPLLPLTASVSVGPDNNFQYTFDTTDATYGLPGESLPAVVTVTDPTGAVVFSTTVDQNCGGGGGSGGGGGGGPLSKDQCLKNGWQAFGVFKNQGDCVSFVSTRGKNQPG